MKSWKTGALMVLSGMMVVSCVESTTKDKEIQIVSVTPNEAEAGSKVTLDVFLFTESMIACFGDNNCVSVGYESPMRATAVVPYGSGTVDVIVEAEGHKSILKNGFTYIPSHGTGDPTVPVMNQITPVSGFAGEEVILAGANLTGTTKV